MMEAPVVTADALKSVAQQTVKALKAEEIDNTFGSDSIGTGK